MGAYKDLTAAELGRKIAQARERRNLSQRDLEHLLGVGGVGQWERGRNYPGVPNLVKIAAALDTPLAFFFGDVYETRPQEEAIAEKVSAKIIDLVMEARNGPSEPPGAVREDEGVFGYLRKPVPVVARVACGEPIEEDLPASVAELTIPDQPHLRAIEAAGDSLEGRGILDGDLLLVLPLKYAGQPFPEELWVVQAAGEGARVRIVSVQGKGEEATVTLSPAPRSGNPKPRTHPASEVKFLARVEGVYRRRPERRGG